MPLSEHEQRLLSEMEQRLLSDDPRFASTMRGSHSVTRSKKRLAVGGIGVLAGLGVMLLALNAGQVILAVLGFVIMLAGASWAIAPVKSATNGPQGVVGDDGHVRPTRQRPSRGRRESRGGFMNRMEQRWERRQDEGQ